MKTLLVFSLEWGTFSRSWDLSALVGGGGWGGGCKVIKDQRYLLYCCPTMQSSPCQEQDHKVGARELLWSGVIRQHFEEQNATGRTRSSYGNV